MNMNDISHNDNAPQKQQIPINYGIDNTALDKALGFLVESQTEINRRMALAELKKSKVIVPVKLDGSYKFNNGGVSFSDNARLEYVLIKNANDEHYCPVFTNAGEFKKFTLDKTGNIVQKFTGVAETVCAGNSILKGIVVNPFGSGITIDKELLAELLKTPEGRISFTTAPARAPYRLFSIPKGTTVAVGTPKNRPDSLIKALSQDMADLKNIKKAWLCALQWPDRKNAAGVAEITYLVVTQTTDSPQDIFPGLSMTADKHSGTLHTDFMVYNPDSEFLRAALKNIEPFYVRKKILGLF